MFARVVNMPLKLGDEGLEISWPIPLRGTILEECPQLHARAVPLKMYVGSTKTWFLYTCILCFNVFTNVCFYLISNVQIVRTFENRNPIQTFEKWHNVSYVNSEASDTWKTFWREGWGKSYLRPNKTKFCSKN